MLCYTVLTVVWMGEICLRSVGISLHGWWAGKQFRSKRRSSEITNLVGYALKVDGTCVFIVYFGT